MSQRIVSIERLSGLGVFRHLMWPSDLLEFGRYNLIYGWNGSGKTVLSRIVAGLGQGSAPQCDMVTVKLSDGSRLNKVDFASSGRMLVRVFNRDFVEENLYGTETGVAFIYVLGQKSKEHHKELEKVNADINTANADLKKKVHDKTRAEKELDEFCTEGAKTIRDGLRLPGRKYERQHFRSDIERVAACPDAHILSEPEREILFKTLHAEPRARIDLRTSFQSNITLFQEARRLCDADLLANPIQELIDRPDVNAWVELGVHLHQKHNADRCLFCTQLLPEERMRALYAHFDEQYRELATRIDDCKRRLLSEKEIIARLVMPDVHSLHPQHQQAYKDQLGNMYQARQDYIQGIDAILDLLQQKRDNPFRICGERFPQINSPNEHYLSLFKTLKQHNASVSDHEKDSASARDRLKHALVADRVQRFTRTKVRVDQLERSIQDDSSQVKDLTLRKQELERMLHDHLRPAQELNADLASYLGHAEITFDVVETGYRVIRDGTLAESLSEGEQTSVAFLYFLKSLEDRSFDISKGIVVIDDPVSSLDSNSLYHAFGFMKSRVKDAGQLFILTHNFLFFRQVKNWLTREQERDARFYMLEVCKEQGRRNSRLRKLDSLLQDYESEYHYLFSLVYRASQGHEEEQNLAQYHYLPNVARRLVEAFVEFKVPGSKNLYFGLEQLSVDAAQRTRILRFCDAHSHSKVIDETEQDPVILGEGRLIAQDVMDVIKKADERHFDRMVELIGRN